MTQFRALPTRKGDAFLLKSKRGSYLVDGGVWSGLMPEMLRERRVGKLRAAVCTFPSPDRLGGILDLLEAGYPVAECWLPHGLGRLPELACRFNGDWAGWSELFGWSEMDCVVSFEGRSERSEERCLDSAAMLIGLVMAGVFGHLPAGNRSACDPIHIIEMVLDFLFGRAVHRWSAGAGHMMHAVSRRILDGGNRHDLAVLCCRLLAAEIDAMPGGGRDVRKSVARGLIQSALASLLVTRAGVTVRYFQGTGKLEEHLVPRHPFVCLNGRERVVRDAPPGEVTPDLLFRESAQMVGNGRNLVFRYGDGRCGALFCGDARKPFSGRAEPVTLAHPTVVTAPGQGTPSADRIYTCIESDDPAHVVWVRSHYSYARKVSDVFKEQPGKVCLNNCVHRTVQEVLLEYSGGAWNLLSGSLCACV